MDFRQPDYMEECPLSQHFLLLVANVTFGSIITLSPICISHTSKQVKLKLAELNFPKKVLHP